MIRSMIKKITIISLLLVLFLCSITYSNIVSIFIYSSKNNYLRQLMNYYLHLNYALNVSNQYIIIRYNSDTISDYILKKSNIYSVYLIGNDVFREIYPKISDKYGIKIISVLNCDIRQYLNIIKFHPNQVFIFNVFSVKKLIKYFEEENILISTVYLFIPVKVQSDQFCIYKQIRKEIPKLKVVPITNEADIISTMSNLGSGNLVVLLLDNEVSYLVNSYNFSSNPIIALMSKKYNFSYWPLIKRKTFNLMINQMIYAPIFIFSKAKITVNN